MRISSSDAVTTRCDADISQFEFCSDPAKVVSETNKFTTSDDPGLPPPYSSVDPANVPQQAPGEVNQVHSAEASETTFCSAFGKMLCPLFCATVICFIYALPFLVVAGVRGNGTDFCLGYWQNPATTVMPAELGGRVRPSQWQGNLPVTDRTTSPSYRCGAS